MNLASSLYLAQAYIRMHVWKSVLVVLSLVMTISIPGGVQIIVTEFDKHMNERAQSTPFIIGKKGSQLDLVLHGLYFSSDAPGTITMQDVEDIRTENLADVYPITNLRKAQKIRVVGVDLEYLSFRNLDLKEGRKFAMFGEAVIGSEVAKNLDLKPGSHLITDAENVFNIAAAYPLKLNIVGVNYWTGTPDDLVVFVSLETSWIIEGVGHGHEEIQKNSPKNLNNGNPDSEVISASAAVLPYTEISKENAGSVHFHGDSSDFPVTAALVLPYDQKSSSILQGRFLSSQDNVQLVSPSAEINELLSVVFQVKSFFQAQMWLVTLTTILLIGLVISLSLKLREREMRTYFVMGCSRWSQAQLLTTEIFLYLLTSAFLSYLLLGILSLNSGYFVDTILASS